MPDLMAMQRDLGAYLAGVLIETVGEPRPFAEVADDWQRRDLDAIAPAVESLVRDVEASRRRCMWIRPRGHGKTADAALLVAYVLAFSPRRRRGVWVAADKDQGCEGLDSIATLCRHNPWLESLLTIRADKVENPRTGSVIHFTTSDVSSAYGWKDCDLFLMDEVTHWRTKGEELWTAMYSAAGKRSGSVVFALMNAGFDGWQRGLRDKAEADPNWVFSELPDCVASWIDQASLRDQQKYVPAAAFDRLWRNRWVVGQSGDAIDPDQLARAFSDPTVRPHDRAQPGFTYCAGLDLGITRHASCVCVVGTKRGWHDHGLVQLAALKIWRPTADRRVDLMEVEATLRNLHERFALKLFYFDPWEARGLSARLQAGGMGKLVHGANRKTVLPMVEFPPSSANLQKLAHTLLQAFADYRVQLYDEALRADLELLRIEERPFGVRLVSPEVKGGKGTPHGDAASAFALALAAAAEIGAKRRNTIICGDGPRLPGESPGMAALRAGLAQIEWNNREEERLAALPNRADPENVQVFRHGPCF